MASDRPKLNLAGSVSRQYNVSIVGGGGALAYGPVQPSAQFKRHGHGALATPAVGP